MTTRGAGAGHGAGPGDSPAASGLNMTATPAGMRPSIFFSTEWGQRYVWSACPPQRCGCFARQAEARETARQHASRALHVYEDEELRGRLPPEVGALLLRALAAARETLY